MKAVLSLVVGAALGLLTVAGVAQDECGVARHPGFVSGECFDVYAPAPPAVVDAILKTRLGRETFAEMSEAERSRIGTFFSARPFDVGPAGEHDLAVIGNPPMSGTDNVWFWVVRQMPGGPRVVLWAGALGVSRLRQRTAAMRDLQTDWCAGTGCASRRYRFSNGRYRCVSEQDTSYIDEKHTKHTRTAHCGNDEDW